MRRFIPNIVRKIKPTLTLIVKKLEFVQLFILRTAKMSLIIIQKKPNILLQPYSNIKNLDAQYIFRY